jgi:energy-coupling factor transport system permease protein
MKLAEAEIKDTFFHRIDVRVKFIMLLCFAILGVVISHWQTLLCVYAIVLAFVAIARLSFHKLKAMLTIVILTVWGIMWVQAVFYDAYPRTPLIYLLPPGVVDPSTPLVGGLWEGIAIYYEGITYGIQQSLRLVIPMTFGLLLFWTEDPARILAGLTKLRIHYVVSFMIMTCIRFLPITIDEARITLTSQRLRKFEPFKLHSIVLGYGLYRTISALTFPLLATCIRKSVTMAKSADSRAFRAYDTRTELYEIKMRATDKVILLAVVSITAFIVVVKLLFYLWIAELHYSPLLEPIYWLAHWYL